MLAHWEGNRQRAYRAKVSFRPLVPLPVQPFLPQLGGAFLADLLVLLAVGPLAVHAAVFNQAAGGAVLELDAVLAALALAVGADIRCRRQDAAHEFL